MAALRTLDPLILVRIQAPQLKTTMSDDDPHLYPDRFSLDYEQVCSLLEKDLRS